MGVTLYSVQQCICCYIFNFHFLSSLQNRSPPPLGACLYHTKLRLKNKNQIDATYCFIILIRGSHCFVSGTTEELATIVLITTWAVWFLGCRRLEVRCRQAG